MTTAEKFRRRQRWELAIVLVVAIGSIWYGFYNESQRDARDQCIAAAFHRNGVVQQTRANLAEQAAKVQGQVDGVQDRRITAAETLIEDVAKAQDETDVAAAFVKFNRTKDRLTGRRDDVQEAKNELKQLRDANPPKHFPKGKCG